MVSRRIFPGVGLAMLAGAVALILTDAPATAFTLSSPSLDQPVLSVQKVWWDRWGRWHPNHHWHPHHHWGWGWGPPPAYGFYGPGPVRHCWRGPWGALHCQWW